MLALAAALLAAPGCAQVSTWIERHTDVDAWSSAASLKNPNHRGTLLLLTTAPWLIDQDRRISKMLAPRKHVGGGDKGEDKGDVVGAVLAGSPLLMATIAAIAPDHDGEASQLLTVGAEAVLSTMLISEALKNTTGRDRPNDNAGIGGRLEASDHSFPSSHVSSAMAGAAITSRWLRQKHEGFVAAEIALFAGVVFVAITRIENDKHWPTDTLAGALLGNYIANTVWDAHYGTEEHNGLFDRIRRRAVPVVMDDGAALLFHFQF
ncbi:MAG: phosphatase PAP2 family protein [Planctomycetota bacterium]